MKIIILNDNTKRLDAWKNKLAPADVLSFTHPNYLLEQLSVVQFPNDLVVLCDRYFYGKDLFKDEIFDEIKNRLPHAKFFVTSAYHEETDYIKGFDRILSASPISLEQLMEQINVI